MVRCAKAPHWDFTERVAHESPQSLPLAPRSLSPGQTQLGEVGGRAGPGSPPALAPPCGPRGRGSSAVEVGPPVVSVGWRGTTCWAAAQGSAVYTAYHV